MKTDRKRPRSVFPKSFARPLAAGPRNLWGGGRTAEHRTGNRIGFTNQIRSSRDYLRFFRPVTRRDGERRRLPCRPCSRHSSRAYDDRSREQTGGRCVSEHYCTEAEAEPFKAKTAIFPFLRSVTGVTKPAIARQGLITVTRLSGPSPSLSDRQVFRRPFVATSANARRHYIAEKTSLDRETSLTESASPSVRKKHFSRRVSFSSHE